MKFYWMLLFVLFTLCGCQRAQPSPTITAAPTATSEPRWRSYEKALAKAVVAEEDGLCEWEILGTSANEVYVWADCKVRGPIETAGSGPAVIYLGESNEIEKVSLPRDGISFYSKDIRDLFPVDVQEKIFNPGYNVNAEKAMKHIDERLKSNGPPLISISGTPLP